MGACDLIYNSQTGAIFTRTPASWGKIGLFYLIYYICLASFFAGLLAVFLYAFTDNKAPLLTGSHSVLPPNPGMGFRPRPDETKTLIKYKKSDPTSYTKYINDIHYFLNPNNTADTYMKGQSTDKFADCSKAGVGGLSSTQDSKPCKFLVPEHKSIMDNCVNSQYGYPEGTPCLAIKVNKVFEFVPKLTGDLGYLELKCEGEHAADKDNIGEIAYYPKPGVDMAFFPFLNQRGSYVSPLVFVKLNNPQTGVLIQIVCKPANAENIKQNKQHRGDGRVTLEVMIDE